MSMRELARRLDIHSNTVARFAQQNHVASINGQVLDAVCKELNVSIGDILEYVPDKVPNDEQLRLIHSKHAAQAVALLQAIQEVHDVDLSAELTDVQAALESGDFERLGKAMSIFTDLVNSLKE